MTCKLNADTSDGLKLTSDTSGEIDLQIDASTKVHMASDGKLGIGTTSPSSKLTVQDFGNDAALYVGGGLKMDDGPGNPWYLGKGILGSTGSEFLIGNGSNELLRIQQSGNILLSTTSTYPGSGNTNGGTMVESASTDGTSFFVSRKTNVACYFNRNNDGTVVSLRRGGSEVGSISVTSSNTSYNTSSDYRLKENVEYTFDATTELKRLKPCKFNFIGESETVEGFLAHEVSDVVPLAVTGTKDATKVQDVYDDDGNVTGTETVPDYQGIDQSKLVPLLVKTCQEQQTIIEDLQTRITALENN